MCNNHFDYQVQDSDCDLLDICNIKQPINKINTNIRNTLSKISLYELTL